MAYAEINPTRRWTAVEQRTQEIAATKTLITRTKPGYISIYPTTGAVRINELGVTPNSLSPIIAKDAWGITGYKSVADAVAVVSDDGSTENITVIINQYLVGPQ